MNGIVPPVPMYIDGLPKNASDALCMEASSQSATGGAFHPAIVDSTLNETLLSGGGSALEHGFDGLRRIVTIERRWQAE